jgi:hypothetical protein
MKNAKHILVGFMMVMSIATYASAINTSNNAVHISMEEKRTAAVLNKALPETAPAVESPAPQKGVVVAAKQYSPIQKAAIVELELKSVAKK